MVTLITHVHLKSKGKGGEGKEKEKGSEEIKIEHSEHKRLTNFICRYPAKDSCLPLIKEYKKSL